MGETLIFDTETNGFLDKMTRLWTIQIGTADGDDCTIYLCDDADPAEVEEARRRGMTAAIRPLEEGVARLKAADTLVAHNLLGFDMPAVNKFYPGTIRFEQCWDTLILARLCAPDERRHSLKEWGLRLGCLKDDYAGDFSRVDADLLTYSAQDVIAGRAVWHHVKTVLAWKNVASLEHKFQHILNLQEAHGFRLDVAAAQAFDAELRGHINALQVSLQAAFPPIPREVIWTPKANNKKLGYVKGRPSPRRWLETFDPNSRAHVAKRLQMLGWKPKSDAFGANGIPTVDETVLASMPYPEAKLILRYFELTKQLGQLSDGKQGWLRLVDANGYVHGRVTGVGCAPGRCSHNSPNMANVSKKDHRMRAVWLPSPGRTLIGVDGAAIQARVLAHYLHPYDGGAFTERLLTGSSKNRTDIHSANLAELVKAKVALMPLDADDETWGKGRDNIAKRCLYASWFGARDPKIGWTAKDGARAMGLPVPKVPDRELGAVARMALNRAMKGFKELVEKLEITGMGRKYLISPSGRHVPIRSKHSILVFLMQAVEADIMKLAAVIFHFETAPSRGWVHGRDFDYCAHVHDEAQIEANTDIAEEVGKAYAACIGEAASRLGLRCPHVGTPKLGANWAATH